MRIQKIFISFLGIIFIGASFLFLSNRSLAETPIGRIAFVKTDANGNNPNIWVINVDSSNAKQITTDNDSALPCFLADGRLIFGRGHKKSPQYVGKEFPTEIWATEENGSNPELLLKTDEPFQNLGCSEKEQKIVFSQIDKDSGRDIYLLKVGGTPRNLTNQPKNYYDAPSFSPDGKRILFSKHYRKDPSDDIHGAIFSIAQDGSDEWVLVDDPMEYYTGPVLSLEGDKLAFWRISSRNIDIGEWQYLILAQGNGSGYKAFKPDFSGADQKYARWNIRKPDFSPDGKFLVFEVSANKVEPGGFSEMPPWETSIWIVPIEGGKATKLTDDGSQPVWQKVEGKVATETTKENNQVAPSEKSIESTPASPFKPSAKDVATAAAIGAIASAAFTLIMNKAVLIKGKPGASRGGELIKLGVYALTTFAVAGAASLAVSWKIHTSQDIAEPQEAKSIQLSEKPNTAKFKEYFRELYLAKAPADEEIPSSTEAIKTTVFTEDDRLCLIGDVAKIIPGNTMATAVYNTQSKKYMKEKSIFSAGPIPTGWFTQKCDQIDLPSGKYERKVYLGDVLVAVLFFEVR